MTPDQPGISFIIPRSRWHTRVHFIVFAWMAVALVAVPFIGHVDHAGWFATHSVLLGAVTNALFIWTWHFTCAILRVPGFSDRSDEIRRLVVLNLGIAGVLIGVPTESLVIIGASAVFLGSAVVQLALSIRSAPRKALPSPYAFTAKAYVVSAGMLILGVVVALLREAITWSDEVEPRIVLAHAIINVAGWIGIPILGTIVTLWPTMLRTRIAPEAAKYARRTLPWLAVAVPTLAAGVAFNALAIALIGVVLYLAAFTVTSFPMLRVMRTKPATSFATRSALAGMTWMAVTMVMFGFALLRWGVTATEEHGAGLLVAAAAGGVLQVLLGSMSYLLPAMAGGGPSTVRWRNERADRLGVVRLLATNAGVLLMIAAPDDARMAGLALLAMGLVSTAAVITTTMRKPSEPWTENA